VVALINGAAMGGGLEIALVAHYRVAISGEYPLGLPEVTLGVLAAGGGVSRTVRMLGLVEALESVLLSGRTHRPAEALALGLVDELVDEPADLLPTALAWLEKVAADPRAARRAWDRPGFRLPTATTPEEEAQRLRVLERRAAYFLPEAPRAVLRAAVGGASLDFEASAHLEIEEFLHLASRPELAVTLQATFLDPREVARARRSAAVTAQAAADAERDAGGGRFVARLDAALRAEMARVEGDGVPSHRIAVTCARLGLGDAWLDDQDLRQAVRDDRIVEAIDPEVSDRLLLAVSLEAVAALQDGTVTSVAEANVLSCEGIGFPTVLGGALGHVLHHVRDGVLAGLEGFRQHSAEMSAAHGSRFAIPAAHSAFLTHLNEQESPT
jgi:enoyl-CoA hydratase/carnithine racemase